VLIRLYHSFVSYFIGMHIPQEALVIHGIMVGSNVLNLEGSRVRCVVKWERQKTVGIVPETASDIWFGLTWPSTQCVA
jgi:hypothetical protein